MQILADSSKKKAGKGENEALWHDLLGAAALRALQFRNGLSRVADAIGSLI